MSLRKFWNKLTEPDVSPENYEDYQNARLFAALLVTLLPLGLLITLLPVIFKLKSSPLTDIDFLAYSAGLIFWISAYIATRKGHYKPAFGLSVVIASVIIFYISLGDNDFDDLRYLIIPVIAGSIFLSRYWLTALIALDIFGLFLIPLFYSQYTLLDVIIRPFSFFVIGTCLVILMARQQDTLARERRSRLVESERRYRQLVDQAITAIFQFDINTGQIITANEIMSKHLGYSMPELLTMTLEQLVVAEQHEMLQQHLQSLISGTESSHTAEYNLIRKNKTTLWASVSTNTVFEASHPARVVVVATDTTARKQAEEHIEESLKEKVILLQEIHHRVKNNLQVISSLISLQANTDDDPRIKDAFREIETRIRAMALIHEKLYQSDSLARIEMTQYFQDLVAHLIQMYRSPDKDVRFRMEADQVFLEIDQAVPCGLIVNELVTNALKHAFSNRQQGEIYIKLRQISNPQVLLVVGDTGANFPIDIDLELTDSLGLQLVNTLVTQLDGTLRLRTLNLTEFTIEFPTNPSKQSKIEPLVS